MNDPVQDARDRLTRVEAEMCKQQELREERRRLRNQLAHFTAKAMVVIDNGHDVVCQGVSPEVEAEVMRLRFNIRNNVIILTRFTGNGKICIHLQPGGMVSFTISDEELDETESYKVWAFEDEIDAGAWMAKRLAEYSSR